MGKIKEYFIEQGLTPADIIPALIIHEAISIGFAMFTWTSAYHLRPTMLLARVVPARAVGPKWLGTGYKAAASTAARQVDKMAWLKRLPGSDPQRLTVALTESLCFRGALKPLTVPGKLWASWKILMMTKGKQVIAESATQERRRRR